MSDPAKRPAGWPDPEESIEKAKQGIIDDRVAAIPPWGAEPKKEGDTPDERGGATS